MHDRPDDLINSNRITITRNFSTSCQGQSLLHQTFNTKISNRHCGAPLRSTVNSSSIFESFPGRIL